MCNVLQHRQQVHHCAAAQQLPPQLLMAQHGSWMAQPPFVKVPLFILEPDTGLTKLQQKVK